MLNFFTSRNKASLYLVVKYFYFPLYKNTQLKTKEEEQWTISYKITDGTICERLAPVFIKSYAQQRRPTGENNGDTEQAVGLMKNAMQKQWNFEKMLPLTCKKYVVWFCAIL